MDEHRHRTVGGNDAKNDFLMKMNHELLTPVNAVLGMADLLWESELTGPQRECVTVVRRAAGDLHALLNDALDVHGISSGKVAFRPVDFDLTEMLSATCSIIQERAQAKGLRFVNHVSAGAPRVIHGDPDLLAQVLLNLLANAVKFTASGEVILEVSCRTDPGSFETIHFEVFDTGAGIPPGKLALIFESFTQADSSITRRYGGAGSGLFIAHKLVEQMGGKLRAQSEFGKGSSFRFDLPLQAAAPAPVSQRAGPRLLLVEDSEDNQLLIAAYLGQSTYRIETASDGREGIAKFTTGNFDLVLMDIQMPEMDGWTATTKMREWEVQQHRRPVPILALTANITPHDFHLSRVAGCSAHLAKPITQDTLLRALEEHLTASNEVRAPLPPSVEEMGPEYLRNRRADLDNLSAALARGDYDAIRVVAHKMKGSGGGYGFPRISEIGKRMEAAAKGSSGKDIETEMTALSDYLNLLTPTE